MQYVMSRNEELSNDKIREIIQIFHLSDRVRLNKYERYYKGDQDILRKERTDETKPCNRIVTNYCLNIVNNYQGYLTGQDIAYTSDKNINPIQDVLNYNDVQYVDAELLRNALVYGYSVEVNYIDEDKHPRFKVLNTTECIPIYDDTLENNLLYLIRYYPIDERNVLAGYKIEVYSDKDVKYYTSDSIFGTLTLQQEFKHYYNQIPIIIFPLNKEEKSIFDCIMTLQDAYNNLLSDEVDDFQAFCDAYLVLKGCSAEEEDFANMKRNRILLLDENAEASYLSKNINDTQIENMLKNINDSIHKIANSPDFSQESFGTSSGIALRFRLLGFENTAGAIVKNMTKALQKRIELICNILSLTSGDDSIVWRDVEITFTRNLPIDSSDAADMVYKLNGIVSKKTLLTQLPFISDPEKELEQIEYENRNNKEENENDNSNNMVDKEE